MTVYHYRTNSFAAPFVSDPGDGFVEANTPMEALKKVVSEYKHPCGLYSASISTCAPKSELMARFLSAMAVAQEKAIELSYGGIMRDGSKFRILNVNGKKVYKTINELAPNGDRYEDFPTVVDDSTHKGSKIKC